MAISLSKGGNVSLTKIAPGLSNITVGLGWDPRITDGSPFDLDAVVFVLGQNGKVLSDTEFVFYNNLIGADGAVVHQGDNQTGLGDGDDEEVKINLLQLPVAAQRIIFGVTIHKAEERKQTFGQVSNAYIRVVNQADDAELARFDLSEDASTETAMIFGEIYRNNGEFKFKAVEQGYAGGLEALAMNYGVDIAK